MSGWRTSGLLGALLVAAKARQLSMACFREILYILYLLSYEWVGRWGCWFPRE